MARDGTRQKTLPSLKTCCLCSCSSRLVCARPCSLKANLAVLHAYGTCILTISFATILAFSLHISFHDDDATQRQRYPQPPSSSPSSSSRRPLLHRASSRFCCAAGGGACREVIGWYVPLTIQLWIPFAKNTWKWHCRGLSDVFQRASRNFDEVAEVGGKCLANDLALPLF